MSLVDHTRIAPIRRDLRGISTRFNALLLGMLIAMPTAAMPSESIGEAVDIIRLSTGESLVVQVLAVEEDLVTFNHPSLGTMTVPRSVVTEIVRGVPREVAVAPATPAVQPEAPPPPAPPAPTAAEAEPTVDAVADDAADPKRWKFKLTFAGGGAAGNTENVNFLLRFRGNRETEETRASFETSYFYGSTDGQKSDNRFGAAVRNDWLMPDSRWFVFARGRYDYDEFQSWLHRVQGFAGVGYELIQPPKFELNVLAGIGVIKEWKSQNDDVRMEGLFGLEGAYDIAENHRFVFATTIYPDLTEDIGEFRWVNSAGWTWRFNTKSPMALSAGLEHEYQSTVDPGRDRNDIRVFAGVDWDF